jgi:hypothetical protein
VPPSYDALAASQNSDDELRTLLGSIIALRLEKLRIPGTTVSIYCDTSTKRPRPYVPGPLRLQVFPSVHDLSHPGIKATTKLIAERFMWPGVQKDCRTWARACQSCQHSKVSRLTVTPLSYFTPPAARLLHVHVDLVGPFPMSAVYRCCLTAVDRFTRWPEVVPITTDQGRQFESQLFHSLARLCGIQLSRTTAHHLACNGLLERFHRTLKAAIMCHADQNWTEAFPLVLLGIRTAFKEGLQASVAELVYGEPSSIPGEPLSIPGELLTPTAEPADPAHLITEFRRHMARLRPVPAARHASPATFVHIDLEKCTHVFLRQDTHAGLWSPLTVAPTGCPRGEIRHCIFSSLCQPTGSSRPTCSVKQTAEARTSTHQPPRHQP